MQVCVIPGDGIGPEVIDAALQVLRAIAPEITLIEAQAGWASFQASGTALPSATLAAARRADALLFGAVASPSHPVPGYRSPIIALRQELDLYANIRPTYRHWATGLGQADATDWRLPASLVIVRENTEDLYSGRERLEDMGNTAIAERVITRRASERIARVAFNLAQQRVAAYSSQAPGNRHYPKVTIVHKANVLRVSDGLFRTVALEVARDYPTVAVEELLVDTAALQLARSPERFDVIVTTNMFGDILSDLACMHGGGLGLASSANLGESAALFEPVHGAALDIAGQGIANPLAAIGCIAMLLEWAARHGKWHDTCLDTVARLHAAIAHVIRYGPHTPDLGGSARTATVTEAVLAYLIQ